MTCSDTPVDEDIMQKLQTHFEHDVIIELTGLITFQNMSSKFNTALSVQPQGFCNLPEITPMSSNRDIPT
jgi:alkylhydroperoxidase family enzyme